jgi:hypothetical protein
LNYFKYDEDGYSSVPSCGRPGEYAIPTQLQETVVHDVRGNEFWYILDTNGFQFVKHKSEEKDFDNDEQIKRIYYPEIEELLKET